MTKKITKAVIPVAGLGTRFLPITKSVPKEMLPIVDKPTLSYIIDECIELPEGYEYVTYTDDKGVNQKVLTSDGKYVIYQI